MRILKFLSACLVWLASSGVYATPISVVTDTSLGRFLISAEDEDGSAVSIFNRGFGGGVSNFGSLISRSLEVSLPFESIPNSIIIEERYMFSFQEGLRDYDGDMANSLNLQTSVDFFSDDDLVICENIDFNALANSMFATQCEGQPGNNGYANNQLLGLYAVSVSGNGISRYRAADFDDSEFFGPLSGIGESGLSRRTADSSISYGMTWTDEAFNTGDLLTVNIRHLFAAGIQSIPKSFVAVPAPATFGLFFLGLVVVSVRRSSNVLLSRRGKVSKVVDRA